MSMPRKIACTLERLVDHGDRVYTLDLKLHGLAPVFRPGQFLHLAIDPYDPADFWPESRVFSIASSPQERQRLRLCYSVRGRFTARMERELRPGADLWIKLPYGDFMIDGSRDAILLAGGTGMSAFIAFLEGLSPNHDHRVWLLYGARHEALWIFHDAVRQQARKVPKLGVVFLAEATRTAVAHQRPDPTERILYQNGIIQVEAVWPRLATPKDSVFYLSGPPGMMTALSADLAQRGVALENIRKDAWE